jgi:hypothetical protein
MIKLERQAIPDASQAGMKSSSFLDRLWEKSQLDKVNRQPITSD